LRRAGHEVADLGTHDRESTDYPDWASRVAAAVTGGEAERGLLVCGSGTGMAMAANRHRGVRAVATGDLVTVNLARRHNDANVLALGARLVAPPLAESCWPPSSPRRSRAAATSAASASSTEPEREASSARDERPRDRGARRCEGRRRARGSS